MPLKEQALPATLNDLPHSLEFCRHHAIVGGGNERGHRQMLTESLIALATLAGQTVVTAAVTDAWGTCSGGLARLIGRGDPKQTKVAERRLEETRHQLTSAQGAQLDQIRAALSAQWGTRLADLLEEDPGAEEDLRTLVQKIHGTLPAGVVSVAAGRDVNVEAKADRGGFAAGVVSGDVTMPGPTGSGPAKN